MLSIGVAMLTARRIRFVVTVSAIAVLYLLSSAQIGILVGWCFTTTAIIRHADADLWIIAEKVAAFDYGGPIPMQRVEQVRSVDGICWAEALFMGWNTWRRADGHTINVELVGVESSGCGIPWRFREGNAECIYGVDTVIVDELFTKYLGVNRLGDEGEMYGRRARVGAISRGVRTFTASPFIFTSIDSARKYDRRYRDDEVTYVIARCEPGCSIKECQSRLISSIPHIECLTGKEFAIRTAFYWMLDTGIGVTVIITAVLGFSVGALVTSQTLFGITNDHLPNFATLRAVGFSQTKLVGIVLTQSVILGGLGTLIGSLLFFAAAHASARTPIPLETTPLIFFCLVVTNLLVCVASSLLAIRAVLRVDPVAVFGGQG